MYSSRPTGIFDTGIRQLPSGRFVPRAFESPARILNLPATARFFMQASACSTKSGGRFTSGGAMDFITPQWLMLVLPQVMQTEEPSFALEHHWKPCLFVCCCLGSEALVGPLPWVHYPQGSTRLTQEYGTFSLGKKSPSFYMPQLNRIGTIKYYYKFNNDLPDRR